MLNFKFIFLLLFIYVGITFASTSDVNVLLSASKIKIENPYDIALEGRLNAQLNVYDDTPDEIHYSYSAYGIPASCGVDEKCIEDNIKNANNPMLVLEDLKINNTGNISIGCVCDSFGVMTTSSQGMYDLFCGPSHILKWNGHGYFIKQ
jgi:hypothetical protein